MSYDIPDPRWMAALGVVAIGVLALVIYFI